MKELLLSFGLQQLTYTKSEKNHISFTAHI